MKRLTPFLILFFFTLISCSTFHNQPEKNIKELGGTYSKEVGEEISKIYKNGGIEEVINTVYQTDYTGGDPYVVVEGYLGEEAYEEFKKVVKELKLEIEDLRKGVNLEKDQIGGNEGLALAVLNDTYPEGLVIEALGGIDKKNTQDFKGLLDQKIALRDELRTILDELGIEGIKEALVNGEYTEEEIETYLGKSTLDDVKILVMNETQNTENYTIESSNYASPVYKSFEVNGELVYRWVEYSVTEYDTEGNEIHFINSKGYEYWKEYDANGNEIYFKDSKGEEEWTEYDDEGNEVHFKSSIGLESWREYDSNGNCIYYKYKIMVKTQSGYYSTDRDETWMEYDSKGNNIHSKDTYGNETWSEYDERGNEIHYRSSNGYESWNEFDEKGNLIHYKNNQGYEGWSEYDSFCNEIHFKDSDGYEHWKKYDAEGNEVYLKSTGGEEKWTEYEYHENGKVAKKIEYSRF